MTEQDEKSLPATDTPAAATPPESEAIPRARRRRRPRARLGAVIVGIFAAALMVVCLYACARNTGDAGKAVGMEKEVKRGPVTLITKVDRKEITTAQNVTLTLEALAPENVAVRMPDLSEGLAKEVEAPPDETDEIAAGTPPAEPEPTFTVRDVEALPAELADNDLVRTTCKVTLEPFLPGEYEIPPIAVSFWEEDTKEPPNVHEIESPEMAVTVTSLLPPDLEALNIKDAPTPLDLPRSVVWIMILAGVVVVAFVVGMIAAKRRREHPAPPPMITPHELAYAQIDKLTAMHLLEQGRVKRFYNGISAILRHYIENRFALRAPEMTTEEFLDATSGGNTLERDHQKRLKHFLRHCDLVKFAELKPTGDEVDNTVHSCKDFVDATKAEEKTLPKKELDSRLVEEAISGNGETSGTREETTQ